MSAGTLECTEEEDEDEEEDRIARSYCFQPSVCPSVRPSVSTARRL